MDFADVFAIFAEWWATVYCNVELSFAGLKFDISSIYIWVGLSIVIIAGIRRLSD